MASAKWMAFTGEMKGFSSNNEAPQLPGAVPSDDGMMEAGAMAGTDESV